MTVLLFIFLYLVIGAAAPFYHYKPVSGITKANTSASAFYQDGPGCDRAMILETNQSAWDERMRLMSLAKERIILSTFDFRFFRAGAHGAEQLFLRAFQPSQYRD